MIEGLGLVIGETSLNFSDTGYFWLLVGVVCNAASFLHARIADARSGRVRGGYRLFREVEVVEFRGGYSLQVSKVGRGVVEFRGGYRLLR